MTRFNSEPGVTLEKGLGEPLRISLQLAFLRAAGIRNERTKFRASLRRTMSPDRERALPAVSSLQKGIRTKGTAAVFPNEIVACASREAPRAAVFRHRPIVFLLSLTPALNSRIMALARLAVSREILAK